MVDFIEVHIFSYHWPDFNVADSSVVTGACLLLLDSLLPKKTPCKIILNSSEVCYESFAPSFMISRCVCHRRATCCHSLHSHSVTASAQRLPQTVRPEHYTLTLTPDLKAATFSGVETIDVTLAEPTIASR